MQLPLSLRTSALDAGCVQHRAASAASWVHGVGIPLCLPVLCAPQSTQICQKDKSKGKAGLSALFIRASWAGEHVLSSPGQASQIPGCGYLLKDFFSIRKPTFEANSHCRPAQIIER